MRNNYGNLLNGCCCEVDCNRSDKCFYHPFFIVWVLLIFIGFAPFICMVAATGLNKTNICDSKFTETVLIVLGVNNILNFCFSQIIICSESDKRPAKVSPDPVLGRTIIHYCENGLYCLYFIFFIFFFVWAVVAHMQYANESPNSNCFKNHAFFKGTFLFNLISMDVFIIGTLLTFVMSMCISCLDSSAEYSLLPFLEKLLTQNEQQISPLTGPELEIIPNTQSSQQKQRGCVGCGKSCLQRFSMGFGMLRGGVIPNNPFDSEQVEVQIQQPQFIGANSAMVQQQQQIAFMQSNQLQINENPELSMMQQQQYQDQANQSQLIPMHPYQNEQQELQQIQQMNQIDNSANQSMLNATQSKNSAPLIIQNHEANGQNNNSNQIVRPRTDIFSILSRLLGGL